MEIIARLTNLNKNEEIWVILKKSRFGRFYWQEITNYPLPKKIREKYESGCFYISRSISIRRWSLSKKIKIKLLEEDFGNNRINLCDLP